MLRRVVAGAQFVVACCETCAARGIHTGMSIAHARALLRPAEAARLLMEEHDPRRDLEALRRLATWALRFAPIVAIDDSVNTDAGSQGDSPAGSPGSSRVRGASREATGDGSLWLDVTGCTRLFRGEDRLLRRLLEGLAARDLCARAAIAPSFGAAWAMARFGASPMTILHEDGRAASEVIAEALAPLPVAALRLAREDVEALAHVEVRRIGELLRLPRTELVRRFGPAPGGTARVGRARKGPARKGSARGAHLPRELGGETNLLRRIDQALGTVVEPIEPIRIEEPPAAERVFDGPVLDLGTILLCVDQLVDEVAETMRQRGIGARRLVVELRRVDVPPLHVTLDLARPTHRRAHLTALLRPRLESINMGFGIESVAVTAPRTARMRSGETPGLVRAGVAGGSSSHVIHAMEDGSEPAGPIERADRLRLEGELIDVLTARLGAERILAPILVDAHLPERAATLVVRGAGAGGKALDGSFVDAPRPTILFDPPEPAVVDAIDPRGRPLRLRWRDVTASIVGAEGPEHLRGPWWEGSRIVDERDYWRVLDDCDRLLWIFRRGRIWCVHGAWV